MNSRIVTIIVGCIILALGCAGLFYPERVMGVLGFSVLNASQAAAALGEIRATYGGIFVVMGIYTLLAALDPPAHRARLLFVGIMWLGAAAGRLLAVSLNGNPGLPGWVAIVFEVLIGGALTAAALIKPATTAALAPPVYPTPSQP